LASFTGLTEEQADEALAYAEEFADHMDRAVEEERRAAEEAAAQAAAEAAAAEAAAGTVVVENDPTTAGPEVVSVEGEVATEVEPETGEAAAEGGETAEAAEPSAPHRHSDGTYREGMPTDARGVEEGLLHEEERTGEDGEVTTRPADDGTEGASA
jgi:hypothetical protein